MLATFIGPSYDLESRPASVQRTVNLVPVPLEPGNERSGWVFRDVPGLVNAVEDFAGPPPPAPVLASQTVANLGFATSWSITAPSGVAAGNLLLVLVSTYAGGQTPATTSTGWTRIAQLDSALGAGMKSSLFAKIATGSDALTVNVNASSNTFGAYSYWRITGCDAVSKVSATSKENGTTTATIPFDEHAPGDGLLERLWIAATSWAGTVGITVSAFPAGYGSTQQSGAAAGTNRMVAASSVRTRQASAETPGNMTLTGNSERNQAWTIAVRA